MMDEISTVLLPLIDLVFSIFASAPVLMKEEMSVKEDKAKEFLNNLKRQKRQLWDRSQPDVQQWYQHFLYLGFDEAVSGIVVF